MNNTVLIDLLKNFSSEEMNELEKFLKSPYFSRKRDVVPLFKVLRTLYPDFDPEKIKKENVYKKLFPGKKYDEKRSDGALRTLTSELLRQCKDYLSYASFENDRTRKSYYLLEQLRAKKAYNEFEKEFRRISADDEFHNVGFVVNLMNKYYLTSAYKNYLLNNNDFAGSIGATLQTKEQAVLIGLISAFQYENDKTLAVGYNLNLKSKTVENFLDSFNIEKLLDELKVDSDNYYPYVMSFYLVYKMEKLRGDENYFELKEHLYKYMHLFSNYDKYIFLNILAVYCSAKKAFAADYTVEDRDRFEREQFDIYQKMLEFRVYKRSADSDFFIVLFRNMVLNAYGLNESKWLSQFIEKYSPELHTDQRQSMKYFSLAHLYFCQNEFEKALENTLKIKNDLFLYKYDIKLLQIKIYYELNYFDHAYALIDTSMHYVKNSKEISDKMRSKHRMYWQYVSELLKLKERKKVSSGDIDYFRNKVKENIDGTLPYWILEKANQLMSYFSKP